jgi:hypothetical protein
MLKFSLKRILRISFRNNGRGRQQCDDSTEVISENDLIFFLKQISGVLEYVNPTLQVTALNKIL